MSIFFKERQPKNILDLTTLADTYRRAHGRNFDKKPENSKVGRESGQNSVHPKPVQSTGKSQRFQNSVCFVCGKRGHLARDCNSRFRQSNERSNANPNRGAAVEVINETNAISDHTQTETERSVNHSDVSLSACMKVCSDK